MRNPARGPARSPLDARLAVSYNAPLDGLPASAAAFSLRKLRTAYEGPAVRVRRSADNAELDIGFSALGDLDTTALLRHAGENRVIESENLSTAAWGKSAGSSVVAAGTHNGSTAWLFTESASDLRHRVNSTVFTRPAGSALVARVRVKANGRQFIQILFNIGISGLHQNFDLENLTFAGSAGLSPTITDVGDGWRELTLFYPAAASGNGSFFIGGASSLAMARDLSYLGDGTSGFLIAQPQVTFGDLAKGYAATGALALDGNGFVTTWYDQSGNGRHALQATAGNQPRIVNAGVVEMMGGRSAIRFVRSNNTVLNAPAFTLATGRQFMVATVFQQTVASAWARIWVAAGNNFSQGFLGINSLGTFVLSIAGGSSTSAPLVSIAPTATSPVVVSQAFGTAGQAPDVNAVRVNGGTPAILSGQTGPLSTSGYALGNNGSTNIEGLDGYLPELIFVAGAATNANRITLEQSQGTYYGITVA